MPIRSTHTFALLHLSQGAYDEIADALRAAGYDHAFMDEQRAIDMHGIGVAPILSTHGLDTDKVVRFYERDFYPLSSFSAFRVVLWGWTFATAEHAYHFRKFKDHAAGLALAIHEAPSAHEAFKLAERHKADRRPDWDEVRVGFMREILRAKAIQHEYVRRKLLATGDRLLVEDSWRDDFWGWGPDRKGQNMLGKLWMELREELNVAAAGGQAFNMEVPLEVERTLTRAQQAGLEALSARACKDFAP